MYKICHDTPITMAHTITTYEYAMQLTEQVMHLHPVLARLYICCSYFEWKFTASWEDSSGYWAEC